MIRCEGLELAYPDGTLALRGIDLEIGAGDRVAVVGPNGSGKTTLVRCWNGLLRPTGGSLLVDGQPTIGRRVAELARIVGLTFQDPGTQLFARTCRAEVEFGARNVGLRRADLERAVTDALAMTVGVDHAATNPYDLGRSQQRLLGIAAVSAMRSPVVVLDEPTIGLDRRESAIVDRLVDRLAAEGRTIVAISHDARFVASFPRVVRLDAGRVVATGPAR